MVKVEGSGFDATAKGKIVTVSIAISTSTGTYPIGDLVTSTSGAIGGSGTPDLRLPFNVDATTVNQIVATEDGNPGLAATQPVTTTALRPILNGGMGLSATSGGSVAIHGSGFAPQDSLSVTLGGQPLASSTPGSITADDTGSVMTTLTLPIDIQSGRQLLTLTGSATGLGQNDSASVQLEVRPAPGTVGISPNPAAVGTSIAVQASGFKSNEPVTFSLKYYDSGQHSYYIVNQATDADMFGNAEARITIPGQTDPSKPGTVIARGITSSLLVTSPLPFASIATLTISPPTAVPGSQILITGSGFVPRENLFVTTRLFKPPVGTIAAPDASGHFTATATLLTTLVSGTSYPLSISGTGGDYASASYPVALTVPPALSVSPAKAYPGATVIATGVGFGGSEPVALTINGNPLSVPGSSPVTDATGAFTATAFLPSGIASGSYTVQALGMLTGIVKTAPINLTLQQSTQWYFAEGFTGQGPNVFFHETLTLLNAGSKPAQGTIMYQLPDGSTRSIPVTVKAHGLLTEDVNNDVGANKIVSAVVKTSAPILAERIIVRTDANKKALDTDVSPGQSTPQSDWYFAEGYSGVTFQPYLTVQNPWSTPISMTVTLFPTVGATATVTTTLVPYSRYTLNLRSVLPGRSFSTHVAASQPVVAERVEYWGDGIGSAKFGAGVKPGISSTGINWYFSYSSVLSNDQSFISIVNPTTQTAHLTATVFTGSGKVATPLNLTVDPGKRGTYELHTLLASAKRSPVAVQLTSDVQVVAEEAEYYGGSPNVGSHTGASIEGRQYAAGQWSFASGDTATSDESEFILNPNATATTVTATFYGADGQVATATYPVPGNTVVTVSANAVKGLHAGTHGSVWSAAKGAGIVVTQVLRGQDGRSALADQGIPG